MRLLKILVSLLYIFSPVAHAAEPAEPTLWQIQAILAKKKMVDLTHAFGPGIPHWPGFQDEKRQTIY